MRPDARKANPGCRRSQPDGKEFRVMPANKKLLILAGDGIGPEVMREVRRIIDWMDRRRMVTFDVTEDLVGGAAIDARKTPIADSTMQAAKDADAILFGAVGGPKWTNSASICGRSWLFSGCARNSIFSPIY